MRAAIAHADIKQRDLETALNVSASTLGRWTTGPSKKDYKPPTAEQLVQIAEITGVPLRFLEVGFDDVVKAREDTSAVADDVRRRLNSLEDEVRRLVTRDARREMEERQRTGAARGSTNPLLQPQQPAEPPGPTPPGANAPDDGDPPAENAA